MYAALLPIIAGVSLASLKELSFTWTALIAASLANQAAAFKNVVSKGTTCPDLLPTFCPTSFPSHFAIDIILLYYDYLSFYYLICYFC